MDVNTLLLFDPLSKFIGLLILFFTILIFIYSLGYIKTRRIEYYIWLALTCLSALTVAFSRHILLVFIFWGYLGLTFFKLLTHHRDEKSAQAAKKMFIIVGASDAFLLFGFLLYTYLTASTTLTGNILIINDWLSFAAFFCIAIGCLAKAGCMPFHTWIPDVAETAPVPIAAYLPAALDKLLGIYLLARVVQDTFLLDTTAKIILITCGALTIICAVMMALLQHNIKRLLGYHAVSQVGYMVLGIGCATPIGIAAGLFHMVNNAVYKSCLFLTAGNVEKRTNAATLEELGGLAKYMPVTFIATLIASLSISGIPPFNGFVSKWMVYQSLIETMQGAHSWIIKLIIALSLTLALLGSGLTLASFMKLNADVFLGSAKHKVKEAGILLLIAPLTLSLACIILGVFAYQTITPILRAGIHNLSVCASWPATSVTTLMIAGIIAGFALFYFTRRTIRTSPTFVGGDEVATNEEVKVSDFYQAVLEMPVIGTLYRLAEKKFFDIYEILKRLTGFCASVLRYLHNGILSTYLAWCLLGTLGILYIFFKQ